MDIVLLFNGLGNQMSQYAFYLAKKEINKNSMCLYFPCEYDDQHNGFELENVFRVNIHKNIKYYFLLYTYKLYLLKKNGKLKGIKGKFIRKFLKILRVNVIYQNFQIKGYSPNFLLNGNGVTYYYGGWHSEKYYYKISEKLLREYRFVFEEEDIQNIRLSKEIQNKMSVSIHVRRGDYFSKKLVDVYGNVCNSDYYNKAIDYIKKHVDNPYFYIFSDDKKWIKENFKLDNSEIVDFNKGKDSWKDMYLMSQCKHNINANSTFSWWGAWLNSNKNKIVIVPNKFLNNADIKEGYPESWIKISVSK